MLKFIDIIGLLVIIIYSVTFEIIILANGEQSD